MVKSGTIRRKWAIPLLLSPPVQRGEAGGGRGILPHPAADSKRGLLASITRTMAPDQMSFFYQKGVRMCWNATELLNHFILGLSLVILGVRKNMNNNRLHCFTDMLTVCIEVTSFSSFCPVMLVLYEH